MLVGALVLAVVAGLLVPRLLAGSARLQPQGPSSAWLDPRYANGISEWTSEALPVGVSADRNVLAVSELAERRLTNSDLVGLDVSTGTELWRVEAADCGSDGVQDGVAWCTRQTETGDDLLRIELDSGAEQVVYWAPFRIRGLAALGNHGDQMILQAYYDHESGDLLNLVFALPGDGSITWQTVVAGLQDCALVGGHVACSSIVGFTAVDASTGEPTVNQIWPTEGTLRTFKLAVDGFVVDQIDVSASQSSTIAYGYAGQPVGEWEYEVGLVPADAAGVHYLLDDQKRMAEISAVDAEGRTVAYWLADGTKLAGGAKLGDRQVAAVAADGSVVLVTEADLGQPALYLADGTLVTEIESAGRMVGPFQGVLIGLGELGEPVKIFGPAR